MERETKGGQVSASEVESVQIKLRVKPALRAKLEEAAKENGVSLSQEIVSRLLQSFVFDVVLRGEDQINQLQRKVDALGSDVRRLLKTDWPKWDGKE